MTNSPAAPRPLRRLLHAHSGNLYGGIETMLLTLVSCRAACPELDSQFALCFPGRFSRELAVAGCPPHMLNRTRAAFFWTVLRARRNLRSLLRQQAFDAVLCHSAWSQAIFAPVIRSANVPSVFWLHDRVSGRHWLERWARRSPPDLVICTSRFIAQTAGRLFPTRPREVLHSPRIMLEPPSQEQQRHATRAELGTPPDCTVIVQFSRLEAWKGHELLLAALQRLRDLPGWEAWILGSPQRPQERHYLEGLRRLVRQGGLEPRVRFLGFREDLPWLLAAADIHCQPNTGAEPFGLVFVEALWFGLPVVTTAMGGALEIVDPSCGRLVPPGDAAALAGQLRELVAQPDLRRRLGQAGPARARVLCDPARQIPRLYQLLMRVTTGPTP